MITINPVSVGDTVRSYDFPNRTDCFVEGLVTGLTDDGRYVILVTSQFVEGRSVSTLLGRVVYPPVNGSEGLFGITNSVVRI